MSAIKEIAFRDNTLHSLDKHSQETCFLRSAGITCRWRTRRANLLLQFTASWQGNNKFPIRESYSMSSFVFFFYSSFLTPLLVAVCTCVSDVCEQFLFLRKLCIINRRHHRDAGLRKSDCQGSLSMIGKSWGVIEALNLRNRPRTINFPRYRHSTDSFFSCC